MKKEKILLILLEKMPIFSLLIYEILDLQRRFYLIKSGSFEGCWQHNFLQFQWIRFFLNEVVEDGDYFE